MVDYPVAALYFRIMKYRGYYYPQTFEKGEWVFFTYLGTKIPLVSTDLVDCLNKVLRMACNQYIRIVCLVALERIDQAN